MPQYSGVYTLSQVAEAVKAQNWTGIAPPAVQYLVIAGGGGGGGNNQGAGGGAGGLLSGFAGVTPATQIWVTVGAGGAGASAGAVANGTQGNASVFGATSSGASTGVIVATGGGYGAASSGAVGGSGGSGGGGANGYPGGAGISGQGSPGGPGDGSGYGGNGGGAGRTEIYPRPLSVLVNGVASDISGTRTVYASGGTVSGSTVNGTANTGNGGWGIGNPVAAGSGGSGVVILSYSDLFAPPASTTGSPTVTTSGAGSLYFDGSGDYITYPSSTNYAFGTNNFTVEGFIYRSNTAGVILDARSGALAETWAIYCNGSNLAWYTGPINLTSSTEIPLNTWTHFAACRSSTTTKIFLAGVEVGSITDTTNYTTTSSLKVGIAADLVSGPFQGNLSNIRILKGAALYTSNFTPPSAPLTNITNTVLLLNTVSGSPFADSSGNATISGLGGQTTWNQLSPIPTGAGYKNRVYTFTSSGSITF